MSSDITFSGISSGLNTADLIDKLVSAERSASDTRISKATAAANAKISALGSLKSSFTSLQTALKTLRSADTIQARTVTVGSGAGFTATTGTGTATGSYSIQVNRLATAEKQMSVMQSADTAIGNTGTLSFSAGGSSFDVSVSDTDTLSTLASRINQAAAGNGLSATVINVDGGQRLVLSAAKTGTAGSIVVSGDSALRSTLGFTTTTQAADAEVLVDGQTRTSSSNTLTDLIDGVSLSLTSVDTTAHALSIGTDTGKTKDAVNAFVTAYNSVLTTMKSVTAFMPGKDGNAGSSSALTGDAMVRNLQQQLRSMVGDSVVGLSAIGVSIAKDGQLTADGAKLDSALNSGPASVSSLFSASSDLGKNLDGTLTSVLDNISGIFKLRNDSLSATLSDLQDQTTQLNARMDKLRAMYTQQYTAMESIVTQMNSISSYLTQQLSNLSKATSSSGKS